MSVDGESHLYHEDGRFRYLGKKLGICAACRSKDYTYGVGALGPSFRFCKDCIEKNGAKGLRREANVALHNTKRQTDALGEAWRDMQKRYEARFPGAKLQLHRKA